MTKRITILQGHPDPRGHHFGNALVEAYADGARAGGHEVRCIEVAKLAFPLLRSAEEFYLVVR
jgi:putative NADPH-quinone reductase